MEKHVVLKSGDVQNTREIVHNKYEITNIQCIKDLQIEINKNKYVPSWLPYVCSDFLFCYSFQSE
jgi:hypothetical protein